MPRSDNNSRNCSSSTMVYVLVLKPRALPTEHFLVPCSHLVSASRPGAIAAPMKVRAVVLSQMIDFQVSIFHKVTKILGLKKKSRMKSSRLMR